MVKIAAIGAGGHTRSSICILLENFQASELGIYDDSFNKNFDPEFINNIPLLGKISDINHDQNVFLSTGDNKLREKYYKIFKDQLIKLPISHRSSIQEKSSLISNHNQIYANTYIGSMVKIGFNNIINTGAIIEHESVIGDHNHISIGALIAGRCKIGNRCLIGAGAVLKDNISICDDVLIGAGSVVINDILFSGTYVGSPARKVK